MSSPVPLPVAVAVAVPADPAPVVDVLRADQLRRDLALPDLTDPASGLHAIQLLIGIVVRALRDAWRCDVRVRRDRRIVSISDNYDVLGFSAEAITRDVRYTRYVSRSSILRTHTSAMIPGALRGLAAELDTVGAAGPVDVLFACPGIVFRRDSVDRLHTGTPHQLDLWRVVDGRSGRRLGLDDLHEMIGGVVEAALPGVRHRVVRSVHPYTVGGLQIDVLTGAGTADEDWVEIGECGLAHPDVLERCGLDPDRVTGLALGLGLDRLVMLRKRIEDIRLLRSNDPRVVAQLGDLERYRQVSACPAIVRDLSVALSADVTEEELGDRVRAALGDEADQVEEVRVVSSTPGSDLPVAARARLGIRDGQQNMLVRVILRRLDRALVREEANLLRDAIFDCLHEGAEVVDTADHEERGEGETHGEGKGEVRRDDEAESDADDADEEDGELPP